MDKNNTKGERQWLCKCDCGKTNIVTSYYLTTGQVKSCGCLQREKAKMINYKNGLSNSRIHRIWANIKTRCYNKNFDSYNLYGGRGITMSTDWKNNFDSFYKWAIENGYKDNLTIDRIDNNGNYEPNNCQWVSMKVQNNNKRDNRLITYNGKTQNLKEWAEELNINYNTLSGRLNRLKWDIEKAFTYNKKENT